MKKFYTAAILVLLFIALDCTPSFSQKNLMKGKKFILFLLSLDSEVYHHNDDKTSCTFTRYGMADGKTPYSVNYYCRDIIKDSIVIRSNFKTEYGLKMKIAGTDFDYIMCGDSITYHHAKCLIADRPVLLKAFKDEYSVHQETAQIFPYQMLGWDYMLTYNRLVKGERNNHYLENSE